MRSGSSGRTSGLGGAGHDLKQGAQSSPRSGPTLAEIQKQSGKVEGPMEDWKKQPRGAEPWTSTGMNRSGGSLGGLASFVESHGEIVGGRKG